MNQYFVNTNAWGIILGGSSGIGLATAQKLAAEGMNLIIVHRDRKQTLSSFQEAVGKMRESEVEVITYNKNALLEENREAIIEDLVSNEKIKGNISLLMHSISRGNLKLLAPFKEKVLERQINELQSKMNQQIAQTYKEQSGLLNKSDFESTVYAMALSWYDWVSSALSNQLFSKNALLLGLTSEGSAKAWPTYGAVSAAKSTLESLNRSMAVELAPYGIRSNIIQAGVTETPSLNMIPGSELLKQNAAIRNPNKRLTRPEDVANVAYLLCREEAHWINGAIIPVDGGERIA
ncbi:MAG: SDR family oxidoreductase [Bacteroidota bacterium]